jgi:uncharacterized integral membrane protein
MRHARHARLYGWLALALVVGASLVVLIVENTRRVKVGWIFGHSQTSLVYLILIAVVIGWVLGVATSVMFRRRTRRST